MTSILNVLTMYFFTLVTVAVMFFKTSYSAEAFAFHFSVVFVIFLIQFGGRYLAFPLVTFQFVFFLSEIFFSLVASSDQFYLYLTDIQVSTIEWSGDAVRNLGVSLNSSRSACLALPLLVYLSVRYRVNLVMLIFLAGYYYKSAAMILNFFFSFLFSSNRVLPKWKYLANYTLLFVIVFISYNVLSFFELSFLQSIVHYSEKLSPMYVISIVESKFDFDIALRGWEWIFGTWDYRLHGGDCNIISLVENFGMVGLMFFVSVCVYVKNYLGGSIGTVISIFVFVSAFHYSPVFGKTAIFFFSNVYLLRFAINTYLRRPGVDFPVKATT